MFATLAFGKRFLFAPLRESTFSRPESVLPRRSISWDGCPVRPTVRAPKMVRFECLHPVVPARLPEFSARSS
jgi:hypothetical protein